MKSYSKILSVLFLLSLIAIVGCNEDDVISPQNGLVTLAGEDKAGKVNDEILLDGSGSFDKANKPFTYLWSVKSKPQGSVAAIIKSDSAKATFTPDVVGVYVIQLKLTQQQWTSMDEVLITVTSADPNGPTAVTLNENITVSTTLEDIFEDSEQPDYIITGDIEVRSDLIIMPGVVIAFEEDRGLQIVNGSIRAIGTSDKEIIFKGLGEGPSYWKGIAIYSNSDLNEFAYVTVKQGGSNIFSETGIKANVALAGTQYSGAALKVRHTVFSESGGYGLYVQGMASLNHFSNNAFFNNTNTAAYIPASQLHKIDVVSFTGTNGLETGGTVLPEDEVIWKKLVSGSYQVSSDIHIKAGVAIEAGASFKMKSGITIKVTDNGYLSAIGSEALMIHFTAESGNAYWNGLFFNSYNQNNKMIYCEVSDAGWNRIADAEQQANIVVGQQGMVTVKNSVIKNGLGYGLVTKASDHVNEDVVLANTFNNLQKGAVFPAILNYPDMPSVTGVWIDEWTFNIGLNSIADKFYDEQTGTWFDGASNPWSMSDAGFGIRFDENGNFTWTVAEHSPMTGCESYSAEFMTGTVTITDESITFNQDYWRSKFINACDETQNVDTSVMPSVISLPYKINKMYHVLTGEAYWELKFINPDTSSFSYYRR